MKTYDDETLAQSLDFMERAVNDGKPFFIWHNTTRTHTYTHLRPKYADMIPEKGFMGAAMTEFDDTVGALTAKLDELGVECEFRYGGARPSATEISEFLVQHLTES